MKRATSTIGLLAACTAALLGLLTFPASAQAATIVKPRTVVLVIAPYFSWQDLNATSTPTLWSLADRGAIGAINARSRDREGGSVGSPLEGALTISSGAWTVNVSQAPGAYAVNERFEVGTAAEAFRRMTGAQVGASSAVFLGLPMTARVNSERSYEVKLGTLGEAITEAGGITAAVGNSDVGYVTSEQRRVRPAAVAAMDADGLVALGDVSTRVLEASPYAPFGIRTSLPRFDSALKKVAAGIKESPGQRALVVLDPGDLHRAAKFSPQVNDTIAIEQHQRALTTLDEITRLAVERFPDATVVVASMSTSDPELGEQEGIGPLIVFNDGMTGYLSSNSTQRSGLVTNPDLTATILGWMDIKPPVQVLGSRMIADSSPDRISKRYTTLSRLDAMAVSLDVAKTAVVNSFVGLTVLVLGLAALVLARSSLWKPSVRRGWIVSMKASLLAVLGVPLASLLMFVWMPRPETPGSASLALVVSALVVWGIALVLWRFTSMRVPVAAVSLATVAAICVDQWLGAPASVSNFFGYSPLLAARFYGLGNEGAAILFGAAVTGMALLFDQWPTSKHIVRLKKYGILALGATVIFTAAAPFFGANVGVAVWGVVGFGLAWVLMNGHHVSWKLVFWLFLAVVVMIGAFAAIDLFGGGRQTHLGRAIASAEQGGVGELWAIVQRKAATNARVLTRTKWAYILVATLGFLGFMRWRPQGDFAEALIDNPHFADAITVSLVAGLVAYFTEDSGIVIPALEVFFVGVSLSWLMLSRAGAARNAKAPATESTC